VQVQKFPSPPQNFPFHHSSSSFFFWCGLVSPLSADYYLTLVKSLLPLRPLRLVLDLFDFLTRDTKIFDFLSTKILYCAISPHSFLCCCIASPTPLCPSIVHVATFSLEFGNGHAGLHPLFQRDPYHFCALPTSVRVELSHLPGPVFSIPVLSAIGLGMFFRESRVNPLTKTLSLCCLPASCLSLFSPVKHFFGL